jgi:two-component system CheB/CheR fusion protein
MSTSDRSARDLLWLFAQQTREHCIILIDREGRVSWWSPGARQVFGYDPEQIVGQMASVLFTPEDVERGLDKLELEVANADDAAEDDRWQRRADGSRFWASGILIALRDDQGGIVGYAKVLRNRTDLREQMELLRNQVRQLESECERKDVFLSTLSHELRNPLAPLSNAVRIIRTSSESPPADVEYALRIVERQMDLLRRLVDDLLDMARVGAGKIELDKRRVVLNQIVQQAYDSTRPLIEQRRHTVELVLADADVVVDGDPDRLLQVFVNLLNNAAKYTPPGGRIWVQLTIEAQEAVVHVRDTGVGIPTDMLPRIFELFTQVERSKPYAQGGLGIGLALVKNFVSLHGGNVQVVSDGEGKGAAFTVRLPLRVE